MSLESQRRNSLHRILAIENSQLLNQIEDILNKDIYTTSGKPLSINECKNHINEIMNL